MYKLTNILSYNCFRKNVLLLYFNIILLPKFFILRTSSTESLKWFKRVIILSDIISRRANVFVHSSFRTHLPHIYCKQTVGAGHVQYKAHDRTDRREILLLVVIRVMFPSLITSQFMHNDHKLYSLLPDGGAADWASPAAPGGAGAVSNWGVRSPKCRFLLPGISGGVVTQCWRSELDELLNGLPE